MYQQTEEKPRYFHQFFYHHVNKSHHSHDDALEIIMGFIIKSNRFCQDTMSHKYI